MAKLIEKDGKFYRMRRGKMVEIPKQWVGQTVWDQTVHSRPSKMTGKLAKDVKRDGHWKSKRKYLDKKDAA